MKHLLLVVLTISLAMAQIPPSQAEIKAYQGLLAVAAKGDVAQVEKFVSGNLEVRDANGRTPLLVAAHFGHHQVAKALLKAGADANAMDRQRYDLVTIAAVGNDVEMIKIGLAAGARPTNITSPYDGTALIAAAHLGHIETVQTLIEAKAPLDHINNLGWTALIEAIILGDGGPRHTAVVKALVAAKANINIADRNGTTPLAMAKQRRYAEMVRILEQAGAK